LRSEALAHLINLAFQIGQCILAREDDAGQETARTRADQDRSRDTTRDRKVLPRLDSDRSGLFGGVRMIVCDLNGAALGALTDTRLLSDDTSILISDLPRGIREAPTSPVFEVPNLGSHRRSAGMFQTRHGSNASRRDWCEV
jgi:hypothetical protein